MANVELSNIHARLTREVKQLDSEIAALTTQRTEKAAAAEALKDHAAPAATPAPSAAPAPATTDKK